MSSRRLVLCAGIPRSGSTWVYNVARLLLAGDDPSRVHAAWVEQWRPEHVAPWHVVKVHEPDEALAARAAVVLTGRRDLRDVAASALRRGWTSPVDALDFLERVVRLHGWWRRRTTYEVVYERMIVEPEAEIAAVADVLALPSPPDVPRVRRALAELREPAAGRPHDPVSLLHPGHVADGRSAAYAEVLPAPLIERINARFGSWLAAHGYG